MQIRFRRCTFVTCKDTNVVCNAIRFSLQIRLYRSVSAIHLHIGGTIIFFPWFLQHPWLRHADCCTLPSIHAEYLALTDFACRPSEHLPSSTLGKAAAAAISHLGEDDMQGSFQETGPTSDLISDVAVAKAGTLAVKSELGVVRQLMDVMNDGECQ